MAELSNARIFNQPHTTLRFVNDTRLLNKNRKFCKNECEYFLKVPTTYIPDFMIVRDQLAIGILETMSLMDYETGAVVKDLTELTYHNGYAIINVGTKDYILYKGLTDDGYGTGCFIPNMKEKMECGKKYFIQITDYRDTWTSEPFIACNPSFKLTTINITSLMTVQSGSATWDGSSLCKTGNGFATALLGDVSGCGQWNYYKIEFDIDDSAFDTLGAELEILSGFDSSHITTITKSDSRHVVLYDKSLVFFFNFNAQFEGCLRNFEVTEHDYGICGSMRLEWSSTCDVLDMYNQQQHVNRFFFDDETVIGEPEYRYNEEGHENGEKRFIPDFKRRTKRYKIESELLPEYIIDALTDVPFFDTIRLYSADWIGYENLINVVTTERWQFSGCYATVEFRFGYDDDGTKTNCCENLEIEPCLTSIPCRTDVVGDLDSSTPVEGSVYFQYTNPKLIEFHDSPAINVELDCDTGVFYTSAGGGIYFYWDELALMWKRVTGDITTVSKNGELSLIDYFVDVYADIKSGLFGIIEISLDGGSTWNPTSTLGYSSAALATGVRLDAGAQQFKIRLHTYTLNCDYGRTPEHDVYLVLRATVPYGGIASCNPPHAITATYYANLVQSGAASYLGNCDLSTPSHIALDDEAALNAAIAVCFPTLSYGIADDTINMVLAIDLYNEIFTANTQMQISWVSVLDNFQTCGAGNVFYTYAIFS